MPQKRVDNRLADFYSPSIALSGPLYAHTHTHTHIRPSHQKTVMRVNHRVKGGHVFRIGLYWVSHYSPVVSKLFWFISTILGKG